MMVQAPGPGAPATGANAFHPLTRSLRAVRFLLLVCILVAALSVIAFLFQARYVDEFGNAFRDEPGAWPHLFGHLLRLIVGACLACCLWRYLRATRRLAIEGDRGLDAFSISLANWWSALAISVLALVAYRAWVGLGPGPARSIHALGPRFEPERGSAARIEFRLAETDPAPGLIETSADSARRTIYLQPDPLVTNADIRDARVVLDDSGRPAIDVRFVQGAQQRIRQATAMHRGKPLAVLLDGKVISAPIVQGQVGSAARIQGRFSREEAERIAKSLSGAR